MGSLLPYFKSGIVTKGFGRGSKSLGTPTANFEQSIVNNLPDELRTGIYFGWAKVDNGEVHKMVTSIGWNPFYNNKTKSMETHIMYNFSQDFYGSFLKICLAGYIRDEKNFNNLDELKEAIKGDIETSKRELDKPEYLKLAHHHFFSDAAIMNGISNNGEIVNGTHNGKEEK